MQAFYFYSSRYFKANMLGVSGDELQGYSLYFQRTTYEDRVSCVKSSGQNSRQTFLDLTLIFNM